MADPAPLLDRRFIVTGGAQGIGAKTVARLAQLGARGVILDLVCRSANELPLGWSSCIADVTEDNKLRDAIEHSVALLGGLDGVVIAAGLVPPWRSVADLELGLFDRIMAVNTRGLIATLKFATPLLVDDATVVAVASLNSWRGDPNLATYAASKHAVLGIIRSTAMELGARGIRVNAVAPGPVATEALRHRLAQRAAAGGPDVETALHNSAEATALHRIATEADVANMIAFLSGPGSAATTGQLLAIDGGLL